ncbi:histidinol dehydrogenase [Deinococcus radiodurans]|jgi:histidinol dehydrogenase (EC 1.1.1.23)|uniref:Histidinol dehydrogenase n=1 Tax=Deinococcus radiodurans (strain ATCC 13939 / DSM 20539 / JCM 16871 / CCUG 27074 / LMG 4051 / NBRC 15346 / NCIMB 9279 / VKM B-1422 / R1) TaxID=243230 RepID=HISX_DEIRA|nr:histidinol dehydrogenase [Deinococcus radiodurans]Q9RSI4.1 RecName: Full=Histidinol dehydrogenase; Short=HDH [Deinococcus radiodurans R1 = ATCC 13939 = DSM 20539]AAF11684.1 histidinol dehydrogenase [Deinococcus radiodurans R1 = ATCC 13939 = DSM 20539]ANC70799.1 histidinol dehydrogenase [Deinococcus radiodurans R1 = ATCC 13939 = DSM 20539]QEM71527.1 histidinol dehydrogenase [Deinococcus radiodurans]QIP27846.1 histidinol dehydrogenase [Deinococcus radiodurans]QIP31273.1 histidinol dehydrogen
MQVLQGAEARAALTRTFSQIPVPDAVLSRIEQTFGERLTPEQVVERILLDVRARGDDALRDWTERLDGPRPAELEVPAAELEAAQVAPELHAAIRLAAERVRAFYRQQPAHGFLEHGPDGALGQLVRPLGRVGVYVPGGLAPLISTLMHTAVPAQVAGVPDIVVTTPPGKDGQVHPAILVAARELGLSRVFKVGGAQAIAALAYGTASVPAVDKIAGPGNLFVVIAKRLVYGQTGIESLPGPTETLVVADDSASPRYVAADLLAQAEHNGAEPVLVSVSRELLLAVQAELNEQLENLPEPNRSWARDSVGARMKVVLADSLDEALDLANLYAPEHLCLLTRDPWSLLGQVRRAGGVFVGEASMEALGDYVAGPSHVMPTGGTARFMSPVNVRDFQNIISVVGVNEETLRRIGPAAATLARAEGLEAHARAVESRLK